MLLQRGADPNIKNSDGKSALDLADVSAKSVLTGTRLTKVLCNSGVMGVSCLQANTRKMNC